MASCECESTCTLGIGQHGPIPATESNWKTIMKESGVPTNSRLGMLVSALLVECDCQCHEKKEPESDVRS